MIIYTSNDQEGFTMRTWSAQIIYLQNSTYTHINVAWAIDLEKRYAVIPIPPPTTGNAATAPNSIKRNVPSKFQGQLTGAAGRCLVLQLARSTSPYIVYSTRTVLFFTSCFACSTFKLGQVLQYRCILDKQAGKTGPQSIVYVPCQNNRGYLLLQRYGCIVIC